MSYKYICTVNGALMFRKGPVQVLVSGDQERSEIGWHISVACPDRHPTWEEMRDARYALIPDNIYMVMILPPKSQYVNRHEHCFHWHEAGPKFFDVETGIPKS